MDKGLRETPEAHHHTTDDAEGRWYICRGCGQRIAQYEAGTTIRGQHRHIFSNPSGIVFEIACFNTAVGYSLSGDFSTNFTWFSGYSWRIVICSQCLMHLGWIFSGASGAQFFGFITDRVIAES